MKKKFIILSVLYFTILSCKKNQNKETSNLEGKFYYSKDAHLSYYFPNGFRFFIPGNEAEYDSIVSTISNSKLKNILLGNYVERHINPAAKSFQYLFKEDSTKYQNVFVNEVDYSRLNDARASSFSFMNRVHKNSINKDSTRHLNVYKDYFINKKDYQIIVNKGDFLFNNDTIFWENYVVSKFYRTFSIQIESNSEINFLPYIDKVQFGDKR